VPKIILVGQAPGRRSDPKEPFSGNSGRRLAALAGLDHAEFLKRFERVNLLDGWPGGGPHKGDSFDLRAARDKADQLREGWKGRKAVLLGRGVAAAFRLVPDDYGWFQPLEVPPGLEVAVMPHPSGISHWWNDPDNVQRAREYMLRLKFFERPTRNTGGRVPVFSEDEVAAALVAGRGIHTWAAKVLAEETGLSCSSQTIANYIERYPRLAAIGPAQKDRLCDFAEHNVVRAIENGDVDSSWKLLRSQVANGRGYTLQVNAKVENQVSGHLTHDHVHRRAEDLDDGAAVEEWRRLSQARPVN
jgi:hypothetical protein